jgi:hypothetical protein
MEQDLEWRSLKLAAVDGVKPSNQALSDSSYPLIVYTYSYYNRDNEKGRVLTDWLLTAEGQRVIAGAGYVGIFGELPPAPEDMPELGKDEFHATVLIDEYYDSTKLSRERIYFNFEIQTDRELTLELAGGKEKDVTALFLVNFVAYSNDWEQISEYTRFIVLTRERSGEFEIINEGEF